MTELVVPRIKLKFKLKLKLKQKIYVNTGITRNHNQEWLHILRYFAKHPENKTEEVSGPPVFPCIISTKCIKACRDSWKGAASQFEPRILAKIDSLDEIPDVFQFYGINLISSTNATYLLTRAKIYHELEYKDHPLIKIPNCQESLLLSLGDSETSSIDKLRYSGLFETATYLNEPIIYGSLLGGRHRCSFDTHLQDVAISIKGVQFETDGCYESEHKCLLIEAKSKDVKSFNIRQLYFPYRTIYDHMKGKKDILSLFITENKKTGVFHIWKFIFENPLVMSSLKCIGYNKYNFV